MARAAARLIGVAAATALLGACRSVPTGAGRDLSSGRAAFFGPDGWNCHQYHADSEFFADFGDYDVTIDVPRRLKGRHKLSA